MDVSGVPVRYYENRTRTTVLLHPDLPLRFTDLHTPGVAKDGDKVCGSRENKREGEVHNFRRELNDLSWTF